MTKGKSAPPTRLKPYPAYKDSGLEWLGSIPGHWEVKRLKFAAHIEAGQSPPSELVTDGSQGLPFLQGNADFGSLHPTPRQVCDLAPKRASPADILLSVRAPVGAMNIADQAYGIGRGLCAISPSSADPRFCFYLLTTTRSLLDSVATGSTYDAVTTAQVGDLPALLPPPSEQRLIATFLDRETARIDVLVAKKERLIELLQEQRTALITRAVTRGLDPNAPMKDSGVEWLGEIPAHWGVGGLSRWWQVVDCKHRTVPFLDEGIALASIGEVQSLEVDLSSAKRTTVEEYQEMISGGREPRGGDVVYSRNVTVGAAALVTTEEPFCMGQDVSLIRAADQDQRFLVFLLRSPSVMGQLDSFMVGSTFNRINVSKIKQLAVCVPPLGEQRRIAAFCQQGHKNIEQMILTIGDAIVRLNELRTALISASVTGKIDVREHAA
jgi:type I restriction enzyme S subunit